MIDPAEQPLDTLSPGNRAVVKRLTSTGPERRRMMDLGLLPGSEILVEMRSPLGDPTAYLVRGALVALRRSQARHVFVTIIRNESSAEGK